MIIRIGRYEVKRYDSLNRAVFRVLDDGEKRWRKDREAEDGKALRHTGTYHGSLSAALRRAHALTIADGTEGDGFSSLADLVEASELRVSELAEAVGAAALQLVQRGICYVH